MMMDDEHAEGEVNPDAVDAAMDDEGSDHEGDESEGEEGNE